MNTDKHGLCKICNAKEVESVHHIIVEFEKYETKKQIFIDRVSGEIGKNIFTAWDAEERNSMCMLLGLFGATTENKVEEVKAF